MSAPAAPFSVSVVLAAHDEAAAVADVVRRSAASTPGLLEVIVVDDGSTDDTAARAAAAGALVLRLPCNRGKGAALRHGIAHARGDVLVFLDADGQDDPREIPRLLAALAPDVDLVIGSRFRGHFGRGAITGVNWAGTVFLTAVLDLLFWTRLTDCVAGFKATRRAAVLACNLDADRYDIEVDLLAGVLRAGGRVVEVPVGRAARRHGASGLDSVRDGTRMLWRMLRRRFGARPAGTFAAPDEPR